MKTCLHCLGQRPYWHMAFCQLRALDKHIEKNSIAKQIEVSWQSRDPHNPCCDLRGGYVLGKFRKADQQFNYGRTS